MKRDRIESAVKRGRRGALWLLFLYFAIHVLTGCAWYKVDKLIDDSNAAIMSAVLTQGMVTLDLEGEEAAANERGRIQTAVEDIDAFIQLNADNARVVNALQVRKGVMLLNAGSPNLSSAAFARVVRDELSSQRDRAIYDIHEPLIWWYGLGKRALVAQDFAIIDAHLVTLAEAGNRIEPLDGRPPTIRYRVEQLRVRLALRAARPGGSKAAGYLEDGLGRYAAQFDETDQAQLGSLCAHRFDEVDPWVSPWLSYIPTVFERGAKTWKEATTRSDPPPLPDWWNEIATCHLDR